MPHFVFVPKFLKRAVAITTSQIDCSLLGYPQQPLYFVPSTEQDTSIQLKEFKEHEHFVLFRAQYQLLLTRIETWCRTHGIFITIYRSHNPQAPTYSAFELFSKRLFSEEDFYSIRASILFSDGKKALEELSILLDNESLPFDNKHNVLINLQEGLVVCGDGCLSNILDAVDDLKAAIGFEQTIESAKRKIIQQTALIFIARYFNAQSRNEIHYVNEFYNSVALQYGVPLIPDKLRIAETHNYFSYFSNFLDMKLTPASMTRFLVGCMISSIEEIQKNLFKDLESLAWSPELASQIDQSIKKFNQRYAPLHSIDIHSITEIDDGGITLVPKPIDELLIAINVTRTFRAMYCSKAYEAQKVDIETNQGIIHYDNSFMWLETDLQLKHCEPQEFLMQYLKKYKPFKRNTSDLLFSSMKKRVDPATFELLRQLCDYYPEQIKELAACFIDPDVDVAYILASTNLYLIIEIIKQKIQPKEKFIIHPYIIQLLIHYNNITLLQDLGKLGIIDTYKLIVDKQYDVFGTLLQLNVLTQEHFNNNSMRTLLNPEVRTDQTLCLLAEAEQFHLISELSNKGLISKSHLLQVKSHQQPFKYKEITTLSLLYKSEQLDILKQLYRDGSLSALQLASDSKFPLLQSLLSENAITAEHLAYTANSGRDCGRNAIWFLVFNQQYDLLSQMLNNNLLTTQQFKAKARSKPHQGTSALNLLLEATQPNLDFIKRLLAMNVIDIPSLCKNRGFIILEQLVKHRLIITEHLNIQHLSRQRVINPLRIMIENQRFELLYQLAKQGIVSGEHLSKLLQSDEGFVSQLLKHQHHGLVALLLDMQPKEIDIEQNVSITNITAVGGPNKSRKRNTNDSFYDHHIDFEEFIPAAKRSPLHFFASASTPNMSYDELTDDNEQQFK